MAGNVDKLIRKLEREGKIRKQTAGLVQIEALLRESMKDLDEAKSKESTPNLQRGRPVGVPGVLCKEQLGKSGRISATFM